MPRSGGDEAAEGRRPVAVHVKNVRLLAIDHFQQRRQRHRIELRTLEVGDVDAQRFERLLGEVALPQAQQRDVEALPDRSAESSS